MPSSSRNHIENGEKTPQDPVMETMPEKKKTVEDRLDQIDSFCSLIWSKIQDVDRKFDNITKELGDCKKETTAIKMMLTEISTAMIPQRPTTPSSETDEVFQPFGEDSDVFEDQVLGAMEEPAANEQEQMGEIEADIEEDRQATENGSEMISTEHPSESADMAPETKEMPSSSKRSRNSTDEEPEKKAKRVKIEAIGVDEEKFGIDNGTVEKDKIEKRKKLAERITMPVDSTEDSIRNVKDRLRRTLSDNVYAKIRKNKDLLKGVEELYREYRDNTDAIKRFMEHPIENNRYCVLCDQYHFSDTCQTVTSISRRKRILEKKKHCMICTKNHRTPCTAQVVCNICLKARKSNRLLLAGLDHPPMLCPLQEEYHNAMLVRDILHSAKRELKSIKKH